VFPGIRTLALFTGVSKRGAVNLLRELIDTGFITKTRRGGQTNEYELIQFYKVKHVQTSEMLHGVFDDVRRVFDSIEYDYLTGRFEIFLSEIKKSGKAFSDLEPNEETREAVLTYLINAVRQEKMNPQKRASSADGEGTAPALKTVLPKIIRKNRTDKTVEKWNRTDFTDFFYRQFLIKYDRPHAYVQYEHPKRIGRMIDHANRGGHGQDRIKLLIEKFFELPFNNHTLEFFASAQMYEMLTNYIDNRVIPTLLQPHQPSTQAAMKEGAKSAQQDFQGVAFEDMLRRITGGNNAR
jgi:hypothetical protein